ncbi:MAG: type II secretion system F family protein [Alphaproteobacteria bacterium]
MGVLFSSVGLWCALGFVVGAGYVYLESGARKKQAARIARVTRRAPALVGTPGMQSLRRARDEDGSGLDRFLARFRFVSKLRERLEVAGLTLKPRKYFAISLGIAAAGFLAVWLGLGKPPLLAVLVGIFCGLAGPHLYVRRRIKKRHLLFLRLFPEAIDLIVRGLRAGLPVAETFQNIAKEIPPPVGDLFGTISQQTTLGLPMERALAEAAEKLEMTEFNFFVTTIILQRETGGNLGEILSNLAEVLRARQMMKLKIGALSSEARAAAIIVGSLPVIVFLILEFMSPDYLHPLFSDFRGNMSLAGATGSMLFGGFIMHKMTQLEI